MNVSGSFWKRDRSPLLPYPNWFTTVLNLPIHCWHCQEEVALLEFRKDNSAEYWAGLNNFYVITRYNHSHMYAMAVYQLSQQVKQDFKDYIAQN